MRADADFMVYVAARWPALVRQAVLLGCPPEQAADAATDALSRCRRDWGRASREENVDHLVHQALVAATGRKQRTSPAAREEAADELLVLAPPTLDDLRHRERENNRASVKRAVLFVVPVLLVAAGAGAYFATKGGDPATEPDQDDLEAATMSREENPAPGVAWYVDGRLHLEHTVLEIDGLRDMTRLGTGVVYGDEEGRVVYAADDGSRQVLGQKDPDVAVAATDETGLAAWFDPDTEEVVAVEAATGNEVLRTGMDDRPRVVAVDGDVIYVLDRDGARALLPTGPSSELPVNPGSLLDVRSRVRAFQLDAATIQVIQSAFNVSFSMPGRGATLSPDGNTVATRLPGTDNRVAVYDTRSGEELSTDLAPDDDVAAVALGAQGTVTFVVTGDDGAAELRTCELSDGRCQVAAEISGPVDDAVLAR